MIIDEDITDILKKHEIPIYMCLQNELSLVPLRTEILDTLSAMYEITDLEDTTSITQGKRYYIQNTVDRLFIAMTRDCEERLENKKRVLDQLDHLKTLVLPEQRSAEWFGMRETILTASSLADALGKGHFNTKESLLIDKTSKVKKPFITNEIIQWGVKYEPIATAYYEHLNELTIVEFGLVPHPGFPIFGASPDGICDTDAKRPEMIGRMLEIKCPPRRVFTDEVPEHYWMQMQGQLETCDLEECDFFQLKLEEYSTRDEYQKDLFTSEGEVKVGYTGNGCLKGLVLTFKSKDELGNPVYNYEYCDLFTSYDGCIQWYQEILKKYEDQTILYDECIQNWWYITRYECTLVLRDRRWWRDTMPKIIDFWEDVVHYRGIGNQSLIDKKEARKNKRGTKKKVEKKKKPSPRNIIKINKGIVDSLQNTCVLDSDSD